MYCQVVQIAFLIVILFSVVVVGRIKFWSESMRTCSKFLWNRFRIVGPESISGICSGIGSIIAYRISSGIASGIGSDWLIKTFNTYWNEMINAYQTVKMIPRIFDFCSNILDDSTHI